MSTWCSRYSSAFRGDCVRPCHVHLDQKGHRGTTSSRRPRQDGPVPPVHLPARTRTSSLVAVCDSTGYVLDVLSKYTGLHDLQRLRRDARRGELDAVVIATPSQPARTAWCATALEPGPARLLREAVHASTRRRVRGARRARRASAAWSPRSATTTASSGPSPRSSACSTPARSARSPTCWPRPTARWCCKPKGGTWRSQRGEGGGCLYDYAAHPLDLAHLVPRRADRRRRQPCSTRSSPPRPTTRSFSTLIYPDGVTAQLSVNWSDESQRKMTTQITIWGTARPDLSPTARRCQVYLRDTATAPGGLPARLERPLHDRAHRAGLVLPARRGVQRPARRTSSRRVSSRRRPRA